MNSRCRPAGLAVCVLALTLASGWRPQPLAAEDRVTLENDILRVEFSTKDGSVTRLTNKSANLELIATPPKNPRAWALLLSPPRMVSDFTECRVTPDAESPHRKVSFEWQTPYKITISAEASLDQGSDQLRFTCAARNGGQETILALRYPDLQGIGTLSETGKDDRLLHSTATGLVFNDPFHLFQSDNAIPQGKGLVASRYPNGFHGSALQLMAYYVNGRGGFSFTTEDGQATDKEFNFFKSQEGSLSGEIVHFNWESRSGASLVLDYPTVITAMTEGTWYEPARRYRTWALAQPWCGRGTFRERVAKNDASRWLLEEIGAVGMWWPFREDVRPALARTRELLGAPLLHLELWWQHPESLDAAHEQGDRFGPFYFPHLALKGTETFEENHAGQIAPITASLSPNWAVMCPADRGWRHVFLETGEDLAGRDALRHDQIWINENKSGCDADCLYYDIGPCAGIPTHCYSTDHGHAPGAGRQITEAHVALINESRERASAKKGAYVPVGTECASEPFVGCLDCYYPRSAGFNLEMELIPYIRQLTWLPDGDMEAVPLFPFVYHEHGPLAIQGVYSVVPWLLDEEGIDFLTWAEARSYLWGGVMTSFPASAETQVPESRLRFLRSLIAARTSFARDYLSYGRMEHPPAFECDTIELDHGLAEGGWLRALRFAGKEKAARAVGIAVKEPEKNEPKTAGRELSVDEWIGEVLAAGATPASRPSIRAASIQSAAYALGDDRVGLLFVNLKRDAKQSVRFKFDPAAFGLAEGDYSVRRRTIDSSTELGRVSGVTAMDVELPPREMVLIEFERDRSEK